MSSLAKRSLTVAVMLIAFCFVATSQTVTAFENTTSENSRPNIVFIMLDDMGYGDAGCYNEDSKIKTPFMDRLAANGMRFTDAHSPGSTCIPARFGLLTGQYPKWNGRNDIPAGTRTIASFLKTHSYATAMVGKWHNGFDNTNEWNGPISGGPFGCGFDYFFGLPHSLDIQPYLYIENDQVVAAPTELIERGKTVTKGIFETDGWNNIQGAFWRSGNIAPGFNHSDVLNRITEKALDYLEQPRGDQPFFLYVAYTGPHTPWLPSKDFHGQSDAGLYGDFVMDVDHQIGSITQALGDLEIAENTIVILTSDNGPVWYGENVEQYGHQSVGKLRGMKFDSFEGGHRMPFIASWPGKIPAGTTCDSLICFTDVWATLAELLDVSAPDGLDSQSFASQLLGETTHVSRDTFFIAGRRFYSVRKGDLKYFQVKPNRRKNPKQDAPQQLMFDLAIDIGESRSVLESRPSEAKELAKLLSKHQNRVTQ